jgi:hypothetical protein
LKRSAPSTPYGSPRLAICRHLVSDAYGCTPR